MIILIRGILIRNMNMFLPLTFNTSIQLNPSELQINFEDTINKKLKLEYEGICSKYGFIKPDDDSKDVFVHQNELKKSGIEELKKNQKVEYELNVKGQKIFASNVKILD